MAQGKWHSECRKNETQPGAPSVDFQQVAVQSASHSHLRHVVTHVNEYSGYLTMPLKDTTGSVRYFCEGCDKCQTKTYPRQLGFLSIGPR